MTNKQTYYDNHIHGSFTFLRACLVIAQNVIDSAPTILDYKSPLDTTCSKFSCPLKILNVTFNPWLGVRVTYSQFRNVVKEDQLSEALKLIYTFTGLFTKLIIF